MNRKIIYICYNCRTEWAQDLSKPLPKLCSVCGSNKIYRSSHHKRYAKKSRSKVRWAYKI